MKPTRRNLLARGSALAAAASLPVTAMATPVDPHPVWWAESRRIRAHIDDPRWIDEPDEADDAALPECTSCTISSARWRS